jgi:alpha-tubulin suppressor-like RCC1 family protein
MRWKNGLHVTVGAFAAWWVTACEPLTVHLRLVTYSPGTVRSSEGRFTFRVSSLDASQGRVTIGYQASGTTDTVKHTCQLDAGAAAACDDVCTPTTLGLGRFPCVHYTGLSDGPHTVTIRATDTAGRTGSVTTSFTIDTVPAVTLSVPASGATVTARDVAVSFAAISGAGPVSTRCRLDAQTAVPCSSPYTYADLADGPHTVTVTAADSTGDSGSATTSFLVNTGTSPNQAPVTQVSVGPRHACALRANGRVQCWGDGDAGRLGYGNENDVGIEVLESAWYVDLGGDALQVSAGGDHSCAVLANRKVRCWGWNALGALGQSSGDDIGDDELPSTAANVNVGGDVVQVATGRSHTCARLTAGTVRCWGANHEGQLGYAHSNVVGESPAVAGDVNVGGDVTQIALAGERSCALLSSGKVVCWGKNDMGELGYRNLSSDIGDDEVPSSAGDLEVGGAVLQIATSYTHTCARLANGQVRCWGNNFTGQLGYGSAAPLVVAADAGPLSVGGDAAQVTAGDGHTCVSFTDGRVRCWGTTIGLPLAAGALPTSVSVLGIGARAIQIASTGLVASDSAVGSFCAALETGGVWCR